MNGTTLLQKINAVRDEEAEKLQRIVSKAQKTEAELNNAQSRAQTALESLAALYLENWENIKSSFQSAAKKVEAALESRKKFSEKLTRELRDLAASISDSKKDRNIATKEVDEKTKKLAEKKDAAVTTAGDEYVKLLDQIEELTTLTEQNTSRLQKIQEDCREKRKPFEADPIFSALLRRYPKEEIPTGLFAWAASVSHFLQNRTSYQILCSLPEHVEEANKPRQNQLQKLKEKATSLLEAAEKTENVPAAQKELSQAKTALAAIQEEIDNLEQEKAKTEGQLQELALLADDFHKDARNTLKGSLGNESLENMLARAKASPNPEDDALAIKFQAAKEEIQTLSETLQKLQGEITDQKKRVKQAEETARTFESENYDSSRSRIRNSFSDAVFISLMTNVLSGRMSPRSCVQEIGQHHYRETPPTPTYKPSSSFSSSGFGTGGGFSSGGFKTGGGF